MEALIGLLMRGKVEKARMTYHFTTQSRTSQDPAASATLRTRAALDLAAAPRHTLLAICRYKIKNIELT